MGARIPFGRESPLSDPPANREDEAAEPRLGPVRRAYTPVSGKARDVDSFERAVRLRVLGWSLVGAFLGLLLGVFLSAARGHGGWIVAVTTVGGWALSFFGLHGLLSAAGRAGSTLYAPSGRSTPRKKEYSLAESLLVRGEPVRAVRAFEEAIAEDPSDPTPYLRIARVHRDHLDRPEEAARWFRRALAESEATAGVTRLARRELVELYTLRLNEPRRAAPILARMAEESAGTPDADWAAAELSRIKRQMRLDDEPS